MVIYQWQEMSYNIYQQLTQAERMQYEYLDKDETDEDLGYNYDINDIWEYQED